MSQTSIKRGEIYWVSLSPTAGHEQQGRRPVLVISPEAFNTLSGTPIVLPITSKGNFARMAGFAVSLDDADIKTKGIVRCDQPRVIDFKSELRNPEFIESVPAEIIDEVLARLGVLLS